MKKYEYLTFNDYRTQDQLNRLGAEGWELVSHAAIYVSLKHSIKQHYIFKREKSEDKGV